MGAHPFTATDGSTLTRQRGVTANPTTEITALRLCPHSVPENLSSSLFFWPLSLVEFIREKQCMQFSQQNTLFLGDFVDWAK